MAGLDEIVNGLVNLFSSKPDARNLTLYEVCDPDSPKTLCGWASIEALHVRDQLKAYYGSTIVGLHISTQEGVIGGHAGGTLGLKHTVFNILFVEALGAEDRKIYRRVGMGKVFDENLRNAFQAVGEAQMVLI
jgi:hypothetical protein